MSKNEKFNDPKTLQLNVGSTALLSGAPIAVGQIPGVLETNADANSLATVATKGVYNLSVKGVNGSGNHAIALGDALFFNSGATPQVNADAGGIPFGVALAAVGSSSTLTIAVALKSGF